MGDDTALIISPALKERAQSILEALKASQTSIVTAESCTAGMIAAILSRADGAGDLLHGGFVTYTKEIAPVRQCRCHCRIYRSNRSAIDPKE